ncbi:hypothetical protein ANCDUO_12260 [Ancylostoma duodenale]|uniref:Uncharacterized protein n=1 Tax=Ancylostoma duodenale TaxID=51022 RepID=A0A0C2GF67_9BILA|nr:hypothetical protein ANCDUO_12260 [Ancylostoma duodenale]
MGTVIIGKLKEGAIHVLKAQHWRQFDYDLGRVRKLREPRIGSCSAPFSRLPARKRCRLGVSFNEKLAPGAPRAYSGVTGVFARL